MNNSFYQSESGNNLATRDNLGTHLNAPTRTAAIILTRIFTELAAVLKNAGNSFSFPAFLLIFNVVFPTFIFLIKDYSSLPVFFSRGSDFFAVGSSLSSYISAILVK